MSKIIHSGKNKIELKNNLLGKETILYNDKEVSTKSSVGGAIHTFKAEEDGDDVVYEVEYALRWHGGGFYNVIRRNGILFYSDK